MTNEKSTIKPRVITSVRSYKWEKKPAILSRARSMTSIDVA